MRPLAALIGVVLIALMLAEFFLTFLLPPRVKREPRIARQFFLYLWRPWRAAARRISGRGSDTMLGLFGPIGLLSVLALWMVGLILGFALLHWGNSSELAGHGPTGFDEDLYFSAGTLFSASTDLTARDGVAEALGIAEAISGVAIIFVVIGYLPALFQAFSRREVAVSQLDPRAGSPPSACGLLLRSAHRGGWSDIDSYLAEWETWAAELMETHLSYPVLAFYRSQHVNQNWLAALTTVLDTCSFAIAAAPANTPAAEVTFAIGRHALADLAYSFRAKRVPSATERLDDAGFAKLCAIAEQNGLELADPEAARPQLDELRSMYEPYAVALSRTLELPLPDWIGGEMQENWRVTAWRSRETRALH